MNFLGWLLRFFVWLIAGTLRWRIEDFSGLLTHMPEGPCIFAFWHNRIFLMPHLFRKHWANRRRDKVAVLVSASKDGEKLVCVLEKFGLLCVRGSSSRRGREALRELTRLMKDGYDIGITPDGPRGPKYRAQEGVIQLAQLTGASVLPMSWDVTWKYVFPRAWDNFQVPLPFARVMVRLAPAITVPRDADAAQRENKRLELENVLKSLSET